jgi:hypothetical protein
MTLRTPTATATPSPTTAGERRPLAPSLTRQVSVSGGATAPAPAPASPVWAGPPCTMGQPPLAAASAPVPSIAHTTAAVAAASGNRR